MRATRRGASSAPEKTACLFSLPTPAPVSVAVNANCPPLFIQGESKPSKFTPVGRSGACQRDRARRPGDVIGPAYSARSLKVVDPTGLRRAT